MIKTAIKIFTLAVFAGACTWLYFEPDFEPAITLGGSLIALIGVFYSDRKNVFKPDTVVLSVERNRKDINDYSEYLQFSFQRKEYIHPKIIRDLKGWLSDSGEQIVSINILDSLNSNRYFGDVEVDNSSSETPWIKFKENQESFGYRYIGKSSSGIIILQIWESGGGSGVFCYLMFLVFETDESFDCVSDDIIKKKRINIKTLGLYPLGDRYDGEILLEGKYLKIGKDQGWFSTRYESKDKYIRIQ